MDHSYEDLRRAASDPSTDWETLHRIAEDYPEFRPDIASNPATYPELIEALAELGDPAIDDALARRFSPEIFADEEAELEDEPEDELTEAADEPEDSDVGPGEAPAHDAPTTADLTGSSTIASILGDDSPRGSEAIAAGTSAGGAAVTGTTAGGSTAEVSTSSDSAHSSARPPASRSGRTAQKRAEKAEKKAQKRAQKSAAVGPVAVADPDAEPDQGVEGAGGSRLVTIMLMVVMPLAVLVVIAAVVINTLAQDLLTDEAQIAEGGTEVEEPEDDEEEDLPADLEEARTAMEELSSSDTCEDPEQDAQTFTAFASYSDEEQSWEEDSPTVRQTLEGIQQECGSVYAAQIHQQLNGGDDAPENLASTLEWLGTDWLTVNYDTQGAQDLPAFSSPTGNVICEMGDELTCTVLQHSFEAPEGCEDGASYTIRLDESASPDCDNAVSADEQGQVLAYGQTAGNDYFACTSYQSQMSCWNKLTGEGINLSSERNSTW